MSDTEIPAPPSVPETPVTVNNPAPVPAADSLAAAMASVSSTLGDTQPASGSPQLPSEPVSTTPATSTTETDPVVSSDQEDVPVDPTVVNSATGQKVVMPDGTEVFTRNHPYPVSNSELAKFEKTHAGDQARYPYVPGDKEYDAFSDPHILNSSLAQKIMSEISSFGERVLLNPKAEVSTIWNAVKGIYESELDEFIKSGDGAGKIVA